MGLSGGGAKKFMLNKFMCFFRPLLLEGHVNPDVHCLVGHEVWPREGASEGRSQEATALPCYLQLTQLAV